MQHLLTSLAAAATLLASTASAAPSNADTSLTFIYQNNLNASDDKNHQGAILLDPMTKADGIKACAALGETLLPQKTIKNHEADFVHSLSYLEFAGLEEAEQHYHVKGSVACVKKNEYVSFTVGPQKNAKLPVLCSQSSEANGASNAQASDANEISIRSTGNTYVGFRNKKSFRFVGIPYASPTARFEYSGVYNKKGQTIQATTYGPNCAQAYDATSAEDCLYMNIQTPYIPKQGSKQKLRPVLMSIYGGGFTGGNSGPNSGLDTGNLASRDDIVGVQFNYRLSTLGFLAIPGTDIQGNFGIGDQITALRWVKENIAQFGGDPNQVTIIGESAGAGSVRALLGSPPVIEENLIAGAVAQSNLGGGVTLGLDGDYGSTYSSYLTVQQSYNRAGQQIFTGVGCDQDNLDDQIACLRSANATEIQNLGTVARYVVQDGLIVDTEQLIVSENNGSAVSIPVIFGTTADDGASFSTYPGPNVTSLADGISKSLGITAQYANLIIDSGLFPYYNTGNLSLDSFNVSQRVATDKTFRCIDEATVYAGATTGVFPSTYYYTMERTYAGYDPNNLGLSGLASGPVEPGYPNGNPHEPYFRLHGADLGFTYGNQNPLRDATDLQASQLISGYFAQFAKTGDPNLNAAYLKVRGYTEVGSRSASVSIQ